MGTHKNTHHNIVITPEVVQQITELYNSGETSAKAIAEKLGHKFHTVKNVLYEYNIQSRPKVYKATFCDKWDFTGMDYKGAM